MRRPYNILGTCTVRQRQVRVAKRRLQQATKSTDRRFQHTGYSRNGSIRVGIIDTTLRRNSASNEEYRMCVMAVTREMTICV